MVMMVSTNGIEGEYRTRSMYGWADAPYVGDLLTTVTDQEGKTSRKILSKSQRAKARRNKKVEELLKRLAKKSHGRRRGTDKPQA